MASISNQKVRKTSGLIRQKTTQFAPFERTVFPIAPHNRQASITSKAATTTQWSDDSSMRTHMKAQVKASWATICLRIAIIAQSLIKIQQAEY